MSYFIKLWFRDVPAVQVEELSCELFDLGALGVSESLDFSQPGSTYEPALIEKDQVCIEAFFDFKKKDFVQKALLENDFFQSLKVSLTVEPIQNWMEGWKSHFVPVQITQNLWIYPDWKKELALEKKHCAIFIHPGMAFGTGTHATTQLCLQALEGYDFQNKTALDMGAGSGVLSIFLEQQGCIKVLACEIDKEARANCQENLNLNACDKTKVVAPDSPEITGSYSVVVANIIDGVLVKLKDQLVEACSDVLVLSGILKENETQIRESFLQEGSLSFVKASYLEEWVCLEFKKN